MPRIIELGFNGNTLGTADNPDRPHTYRMRTWVARRCQQAIHNLPEDVGASIAATIVSLATGALTSDAAKRIAVMLKEKQRPDIVQILELARSGLDRISNGLEVEGVVKAIMQADMLHLFVNCARGSLIRVQRMDDGTVKEIDVVPAELEKHDAQEKTDDGVDNFYSAERFAEILPLTLEMLRRNLGPLGRPSLWIGALKLGTLVPNISEPSKQSE